MATWSLVMMELATVAHLIRARFTPPVTDRPQHRAVTSARTPGRAMTKARTLQFEFETPVSRLATIDGRTRCVPEDVFRRLQETNDRFQIPFPSNDVFLAAGPGPFRVPLADAAVLDGLIKGTPLSIADTLALFRTPNDGRPNKNL
ncbi:hypothetical protein PHMEG_00034252 [Phytophthora megakarya]|uniref:Uncharacterized protein n=1 Tax=Phytophthora megakarya TaxID=4795 RepID=A0A225URX7_9STRA|nr:hypothetical protein PHMEG_00034252 [Phytophthora megakarya]